MGDTIGSIMGAMKGPPEQPIEKPSLTAGGYTPTGGAGAGAGQWSSLEPDAPTSLIDLRSSPMRQTVAPASATGPIMPTNTGFDFTRQSPAMPPTNVRASGDLPGDAGKKYDIQGMLGLANGVANTARGIMSDSRGPGGSPLAPRAGAGGMPYQPTARNRPMRLKDILASR